jgi:hypothetical protein
MQLLLSGSINWSSSRYIGVIWTAGLIHIDHIYSLYLACWLVVLSSCRRWALAHRSRRCCSCRLIASTLILLFQLINSLKYLTWWGRACSDLELLWRLSLAKWTIKWRLLRLSRIIACALRQNAITRWWCISLEYEYFAIHILWTKSCGNTIYTLLSALVVWVLREDWNWSWRFTIHIRFVCLMRILRIFSWTSSTCRSSDWVCLGIRMCWLSKCYITRRWLVG